MPIRLEIKLKAIISRTTVRPHHALHKRSDVLIRDDSVTIFFAYTKFVRTAINGLAKKARMCIKVGSRFRNGIQDQDRINRRRSKGQSQIVVERSRNVVWPAAAAEQKI